MYDIRLTVDELEILASMRDHGYDCGMFEAINHEATRVVHVHDEHGDDATYRIPEHVIWEVSLHHSSAIETGNPPWGPYEHPVIAKLEELLNGVV